MNLYWTIFCALVVLLIFILIGRRGRLKLSSGAVQVLKCCARLLKWSVKGGSISLACLAVLLLIFYAEEDWRGKQAWEQCKRQLEAQGEQLDWKDFIPPPVPDDQNFALTPIVAGSYESYLDTKGHLISPPNTNVVDRLGEMNELGYLPWNSSLWTNALTMFGDWQEGKKIDLKAWQAYLRKAAITNDARITNEFPITPVPQTPAADVLLALSKYDSAIEELRQASRLPYSRFPLNYDTDNPSVELRLPPLPSLVSCLRVLSLRAAAELDNGRSEKALADVKLILYLAHSVHGINFFIQDEQAVFLNFAIQPVWEGTVENKWSADQLASIQQELSGVDLLSGYNTALRAERAMALSFIEHERRTHDADHDFDFIDEDELDFQERTARLYHRLFPQGWYYQNEAILAETFQQSFRTEAEAKQNILSPEIARRNDLACEMIGRHRNSPYYYYNMMYCPAGELLDIHLAFHQTSIDMASIACALERYRLAHGGYPKTLDELSPQFMKTIPHDIINGQPLHYRRTTDGKFLLYSVGWNEKDDGGRRGQTHYGRMDYSDGDWVWPTTAQ